MTAESAGIPAQTEKTPDVVTRDRTAPLPLAGLDDAPQSDARRVEELLGCYGIDRRPVPRRVDEGRWEMEVAAPGFSAARAAASTREAVLRAIVPELEAALTRYAGDARARAARLLEVAEDIERTVYRRRSL